MNTNQNKNPILQFAIYLYCKVHLALLHHLKGVGQIRHKGHRPANLLARIASNPPEIYENQ